MKYIIITLMIFLFSACASLSPVEQSSQDLHKNIKAGSLLQIGDDIKVITINGNKYAFEIKEITHTHILGSHKRSVLIDEIATLEVKEINRTQSTMVLAGVGVTALILVLLHQPKEIGSSNF